MGDELTIETFVTMMEATQAEIEALNTALNQVTQPRRSVRDKERALAKFKERLQMAIAVRYGKDSEQYRIIHPPARKKRKTTAPESAVVLSQQDAVAFLTEATLNRPVGAGVA
jgi:hypothetical protein